MYNAFQLHLILALSFFLKDANGEEPEILGERELEKLGPR